MIDMKGHSTAQGFELNGFDCIPRMSLRRRQKYVIPLFLLSAVADEVHRRSTRGPCCGNAWSTQTSSLSSVSLPLLSNLFRNGCPVGI